MAYNEQLVNRIREALSGTPNMEEKAMFGGICFMVNEKMCVGVVKDEMMCRIDPGKYEEALEKPGCRPMGFAGKEMKGFVFVDEHGMKHNKDFNYWIDLCLAFNPKAKASKKKKP
jgi:TfoX/Sxy family transcriptional regulator of competence genes